MRHRNGPGVSNRVRRFQDPPCLRWHATNHPYHPLHNVRIRLIQLEKLPPHLPFPWPSTLWRPHIIDQPQCQHPELPQQAGKTFPYFFPSIGLHHASPRVPGKVSDAKPGNVRMHMGIGRLQETVQVDAFRNSNAFQRYLKNISLHGPGNDPR
ncbi:unnamed protein product [Trypanosoma congolense IL3000]|uniref:WGS project CAEQ00000000 data, annotated contig 573 n=1 Tax=Trypanosoma congolense (strain IL3000) TaxID=1068625 RepID=F9WGY5_TRYCI|nr:unnamed protein product [Trypanosoma congolense IL3000]